MGDVLPDRDDRAVVLGDLDTTIMVEAGAGTGKTEALVGRIVEILASGRATTESVAAITFTVAAASELRARVRSRLESALGLDGTEGEVARLATSHNITSEVVIANVEAALRSIDRGAITTIHSFAQTILSTFPLQAGLPPKFAIADEVQASIDFHERWGELVDELFELAENGPLMRAATLLDVRLNRIEDLATVFHNNWDKVRDASVPRVAAIPIPDQQPAVVALEHAISLAAVCTDPDDKLFQHLESLRSFNDKLRAASGDDLIDLLVNSPHITAGKKGQAGNWGEREQGKETKEKVLGSLIDAAAALDAALEPTKQAVITGFASLLREFTLAGVDRRRTDGELEFHDLLVFARDLLRGDDLVRAALRDQFKYLLVDEFQDTDPLQVEICALLATGDGRIEPSSVWNEFEGDQGRTFFVGDPKQSIYRFRRADIEIYQRAKSSFGAGAGGQPPTPRYLTANFRSHFTIVDWVNAVMGELIGGLARDGGLAYVPLVATRTGEHPDAGVRVKTLGEASDAVLVAELRKSEFEAVARAIDQIVESGWRVKTRDPSIPDGVSKGEAARFRDIAVLIRDRTSLPALEDAFEAAGIPYRLESRALVFASQEVRDLMAVMAAVVDPGDDVAVVAALKSTAFGCSDRDLLEYARAPGRHESPWNLDSDIPDRLPKGDCVADGIRALRHYREEVWWRGPTGLLDLIVAERQLLEKAVWSKQRREKWRRVKFLVDRCRAFVDGGGGGLAEFLGWARRQSESASGSGEALLADPDEDAVRVTTIHGSKGLQYPVVFVAGIGRKPRAESYPAVWVPGDAEESLEISLKSGDAPVSTSGYETAIERESGMAAAELLRLLYVATTRAEDHLIVSLFRETVDPAKKIEELSGAEVIARGIEAAGLTSAPFDFGENTGEPHEPGLNEPGPMPDHAADDMSWEPPDASEAEQSRHREDLESWRASRLKAIAGAQRTPMYAATGVFELIHAVEPARGQLETESESDPTTSSGFDREEAEPDAETEASPWRRGRAGTAIGRAVHGVLQVIDLATGTGIEELCSEQAAAENIDHLTKEISERVAAALASDSIKAAVSSGEYWREVFVAAMVGDAAGIEGYIDLLYRTSEGLVVVDYKTDGARGDADIERLMAKYKYQGGAYALSIERALGESVAGVRFVFAQKGGAIERDVKDLDAVVSEIRTALVAQR